MIDSLLILAGNPWLTTFLDMKGADIRFGQNADSKKNAITLIISVNLPKYILFSEEIT